MYLNILCEFYLVFSVIYKTNKWLRILDTTFAYN